MRPVLSIAFLLLALWAAGQVDGEIDLEAFAESRFQLQDEDINYEDLYESLLLYYTNPINLNKTSRTELASLYILSPIQLNAFFDYRSKHGKFLSRYELQAIPEWDLSTIRDLMPFVTLTELADGRPMLQRIMNEENNYLLLRYSRTLETEEGYQREDGSGYLGDQSTLYGRFRVGHPHDFSLGVTFEKDAGEEFAIAPEKEKYGFDFYSFHFMLENKGMMKALAVGDYQLQFGQGLVYGAGFGTGKGAETVNTIKRSSVGLRPYASVLESGFFRGAATTLSFGSLDATVFGSTLLQDANVISDTTYTDFDEFVNSIQATGYHRTANEATAKNTIHENATGFALDYTLGHSLSIGATGLYSGFSKAILKKPNNYNQYEFNGTQNLVGSLYANYNFQNFILFGEIARSSSGGIGAVGGLLASLTPQIDFSWLVRNYQKNFHSFYGNAFGEGSRNINESGVYWGLMYKPSRKYQFSAYFDKFSFPWLRYRVDAPSEGFEYLGRFTYKPARSVQMYAQFRQENKGLSVESADGTLSELTEVVKRNYLFNVDYAIGRTFSFKTRAQSSDFLQDGIKTHGLALVQDVNLSFRRLRFSTRFALFETDDFNNSQYLYERNVLYAFSIPAYNGVGSRSYLLVQYNASRSLSLWARYARFQYANADGVGTGLQAVPGDTRSEIRLMLRYKFRD